MSRVLARQLPQCCLLLIVLVTGISQAQPQSLDFGNLENGLPEFGAGDSATEELLLTGLFRLEKGTRTGKLEIHAKAQPSWHTYSTTKGGAPSQTKLEVEDSAAFKVLGPFTPDRAPHMGLFAGSQPIEEFEEVVWSAPIQITEGVDPATLTINVTFDGQVCGGPSGACIPIFTKIPAAFYEPAPATGSWTTDSVKVTGRLEPAEVVPGGNAQLFVTVTPDEGWRIYEHKYESPDGYTPTTILLKRSPAVKAAMPHTSTELVEKEPGNYYKGETTFTLDLQLPKDIAVGEHELTGLIRYAVCNDKGCKAPELADFSVVLTVGATEKDGSVPFAFSESKTKDAELKLLIQAAKLEQSDDGSAETEPLDFAGLSVVLLACFVGGLILNLMPCVLPVIGLKILSFAEQAGQQRSRVFMLNVWYSAGLITVFLLLAVLAAFLNFSWGEQFTLTWFKVALVGLVFAMALSFLGVWEIPIPGFAGGSAAQKLQSNEGVGGAFSKGVFTTILATPCSGPFLGPLFALTLSNPPLVTFLIFGTIGLGMASPYLLIGAFPSLLRFIPKPGAWMETFKQFMAFLLLGTVVYLFSTISSNYFIPTLAFVVGIWFACWLIGRIPITADSNKKVRGWAIATFCAAAVGLFAFNVLVPSAAQLPWKPYTEDTLAQARAEGKTVMIDFTADWCPNCKWNLKTAINRRKVLDKVSENEVVPLLADWTDKSDTIKNKLLELKSNSIPILAIYPAGKPDSEVIILRDVVSQAEVLEALEQAGPSAAPSEETKTASRE